eukprot:1023767-Prorocentrum_minimum.AAC.1
MEPLPEMAPDPVEVALFKVHTLEIQPGETPGTNGVAAPHGPGREAADAAPTPGVASVSGEGCRIVLAGAARAPVPPGLPFFLAQCGACA